MAQIWVTDSKWWVAEEYENVYEKRQKEREGVPIE